MRSTSSSSGRAVFGASCIDSNSRAMARADVLVLACACMHVPGGGAAVEFVGTLQDADPAATTSTSEIHEHEGSLDHLHQTIHGCSDDIDKVLKTVNGSKAGYHVQGKDIYVRARITSSKLHPNPYAESDPEMAWTQPLVVVKVSDSYWSTIPAVG